MNSPTIAELKANIKRLDAVLDAANEERGYCVLEFPATSDTFAIEVYDRYIPSVRKYLNQYADVIVRLNDFPEMDGTGNITHWIDCLTVVSHCGIESLRQDCFMYIHLLHTAIGSKDHTRIPIQVASAIVTALNIPTGKRDFTYEYELQQRDYDGQFDAYLARKLEEIRQWQALH